MRSLLWVAEITAGREVARFQLHVCQYPGIAVLQYSICLLAKFEQLLSALWK